MGWLTIARECGRVVSTLLAIWSICIPFHIPHPTWRLGIPGPGPTRHLVSADRPPLGPRLVPNCNPQLATAPNNDSGIALHKSMAAVLTAVTDSDNVGFPSCPLAAMIDPDSDETAPETVSVIADLTTGDTYSSSSTAVDTQTTDTSEPTASQSATDATDTE